MMRVIMNSSPQDDGLLDKHKAAKLIGIHERTLDLWQSQRRIPFIKLGAGRRALVRFRRADLESFLETHRVAAIGGAV
jgi:excisionase family DNA binding protein